jgi:hypothetical protein
MRRTRTLAGLSLSVLMLLPWPGTAIAADGASGETRAALPPPVVDPRSTESCLNSRISYHGGWSTAASEQMMADVLHAAARAPLTAGQRQIYVATPQNVYLYDAVSHSLLLHKSGDSRSDATAAFEVGIAASSTMDAGAAMHLAQVESIALWTGTTAQLASCPRASATTYANSHWNPTDPIDIAVSFGIRNVAGITTSLVAVSSDGTLPNPATDGSVFLDDVLADLAYDSTFAGDDLTLAQDSQILWATYGCSNHLASGKAGLVCSSAVANYYLTRRVYAITANGVYRYHVRRPPGSDATTRDHRLELVVAGDVRPALRSVTPRIPEAPVYLILCLGSTGAWPELEVGFAAMGAVLEASTLGLQGYLTSGLSALEQGEIQETTGIPPADLPMAVVSLGHPTPATGIGNASETAAGLRLRVGDQPGSAGRATIHYVLPNDAPVAMAIYDPLGRCVRNLIAAAQDKGSHTAVWDYRNDEGQPVPSGVYFCRLMAGTMTATVQVIVVR